MKAIRDYHFKAVSSGSSPPEWLHLWAHPSCFEHNKARRLFQTTGSLQLIAMTARLVAVVNFASVDCCDREAMGAIATTAGLSGQMVQDLMLKCVEKRFGALKAPHPVEWLTDNGSCYTAKETVAFASMLGLLSRFTPVRSPESNGMAEAFVKTFKRDYLFVHERPNAATVLALLPGWFEDYNERHPHKGLRMKSPREFIRSSVTAECPV